MKYIPLFLGDIIFMILCILALRDSIKFPMFDGPLRYAGNVALFSGIIISIIFFILLIKRIV